MISNSGMTKSLKGKTIVVGVCGGIAAYKSCELVRLFIEAGADVHVMMSKSAQQFIGPLTFQTLTGNPCHTELFDLTQEQEISHIALADRADAMVIAPATANIIAKLAYGLADDLLSTVVLATQAPLVIAPSMNVNMWDNVATQDNVATLKKRGHHMLDPESGYLACGWEGKGRLPDPQVIFDAVRTILEKAPKQLQRV